jgi:glutamate synthase (NADPH/NADH) small chain
MFEALHRTGGVLRYGIPAFRLPRKVLNREIKYIKSMGVSTVTDCVVGRTRPLKELAEDYDAVFIGTGAGLPGFMGIEGEDLGGVYSANEYLTRINLMKAHKFPEYHTPIKAGKSVVVVGAGNVAMDSARVAKRLGADVTVVYRRSQNEMPARKEEIGHAQEEGIKFLLLTQPKRIMGCGFVEGVECVQMMLGEEDETGRRAPVAIDDSEFTIECDQVIMAIGQKPNPMIARTSDIDTGFRGEITVEGNMQSSIPNVFAGGDIVSGSATVIKAIADGKKASQGMIEFLKGK